MKQLYIAALLAGLMGCASAPLTEEQKYDRQERMDLFLDKYERTVLYCAKRTDAYMEVDWHCRGIRHTCPPRYLTDRFWCVKRR